MIPTPEVISRLALLVVAVVVLQVAGFSQLRIFGGSPDLVPLLVGAVALYAGSVPGAATGFAAGLLLDLAVGQNIGASSLVLTAVGYGVGRFRELRDPAHGLLPIAAAAAATAAYVAGYSAVSFMLGGVDAAVVSALVIREMLVTVTLGALIALPTFAVVRRVLRPGLPTDSLERVRRSRPPAGAASPTGPRRLGA